MPFTKIGSPRISHSAPDYGTYGVVTSTMTAKTYDGDIFAENIPINAEAVLSGFGITSPTYYVTGRKVDGRIAEWTLCDAMSKTEQTLTFSDSDFINDKINFNSVLGKIQEQFGFAGLQGVIPDMSSMYFERSRAEGSSGRELLTAISEVLVGYWSAYEDKLKFTSFGVSTFSTLVSQYSKIIYGSSKTISRLIMSDGSGTYIAGDGDPRNTLTVQSDYASDEAANSALERMLGSGTGYCYRSWRCEKGLTSFWLYLGTISFNSECLSANSITMIPSATGMFFSAAGNAVTEDEATYLSEMERNLNARVALGRVNGNTVIDRKGVYLVENDYKKKQKENPEKPVKYGFDVKDSGITKYDGAMVDKKMPAITINSDATAFTLDYEGQKLKYKIAWDGNNPTLSEDTEEGD